MQIRVALADREYLVAQALAQIMGTEPDISIVGMYTDGPSLLRGLCIRKADVVVLDPAGLTSLGTGLIRRIRDSHPATAVVVLTANQRERQLFSAVRAGVRGYLSKSASVSDVREAIRSAASGGGMLSPEGARQLMEAFARQSHEDIGLTPRQRDMLSGLVRGKTNREIASALDLSEKTVKNYMKGLFAVLGVRDRTEAAVQALQLDLVSERDWTEDDEEASAGVHRKAVGF